MRYTDKEGDVLQRQAFAASRHKKTPLRGVFCFDTILIEVVLTPSVAIDWLVQALQYRPVQ